MNTLLPQKDLACDQLLTTATIWMITALCMLSFARTVGAEEQSKQEGIGLLTATQSAMENIDRYDVIVKIDISASIDDRVVPEKTIHLRIAESKVDQFFFFAFYERKLAAKGDSFDELDDWSIRSSVLTIDGVESKTHFVGRGYSKKTWGNYNSAREGASANHTLALSGLREFTRCMLIAKEERLALERILSKADRIETSDVVGEDSVVLKAVINGPPAIETHKWVFDLNSLRPTLYEIAQGKDTLQSTAPILKQRTNWREDNSLGWVPIESESTQRIRFKLTGTNGRVSFYPAERWTDVQLQWNDWTSQERVKKELVLPIYKLDDIQRLVDDSGDKN